MQKRSVYIDSIPQSIFKHKAGEKEEKIIMIFLIKLLICSFSIFSIPSSASVVPFISKSQDADIAELPSVVSDKFFNKSIKNQY